MAEPDLVRIKSNVAKMVAQGAPETDIDAYIAGEGTSVGAVQGFKPDMSWGDVAVSAVKNIPSSAVHNAEAIVQPIVHPIDTAENIYNVGKGLAQKAGIVSGDDAVKYPDAVGAFFKDRYGSMDGFKRAVATDPVGVVMDAATVLTAGGAGLARAPGVVGTIGEIASTAGRAIDPLTAVGKVVKGAGHVAAEVTGITTGAGSEAIRTAARAGAEGGAAAGAFRAGMSGAEPAATVVNEARAAVNQLRAERGTAYRDAMTQIGADTTVLNFNKIDNAVNSVAGVKNYKGQDLSPSTKQIRADMVDAVNDWRALPPQQFHTAEGLDALKQKIGDIRDATQPSTPERVVADQIYQGVRKTIIDQAPEYAKAMKGYEEASTIIREVEKTLSLNPKASVDTALRKLQSVLRNNVNTNYGRRAELVDFLTRAGAPHLMEKLAGQTLSSVAPRGLSRVLVGGEGLGALTAIASGHPGAAAALAGGTLASSPALAGGLAYGLGATARLPIRGAIQSDRALGGLGSPK